MTSAMQTLLVHLVVLAPLAAALLAIMFRSRTQLLNLITVCFAFVSFLASTVVASVPHSEPLKTGLLYLDSLSIYFVLLVNMVAFVASWYAVQFLAADRLLNANHSPSYFHVFFNLFHFTMLVVPMVDSLIILWIAVELTTVFSALLVRYRRDRPALEAAWKFTIITTTGIIFALIGTLFLANAIGDSGANEPLALNLWNDPMRWSSLAQPERARALDSNFVRLSFLFILIGYGTKAGLAPMHTWLPDGHGEAPSPVSALLSGVMLKSALYAILRFYTIANLNLGDAEFTSWILIAVGLVSLVLAIPFILKDNHFKRILAYHSLEHMGIITFGIGLGSSVALFGALLHALNHALTKALMFLLFGRIQDQYNLHSRQASFRSGSESVPLQGVLTSMPLAGIILGSGGLALVGSPPFSIFMSELIIFWAAIQKIQEAQSVSTGWAIGIAAFLFILSVTIIFGGLVRHISRILLDRPPFSIGEPKPRRVMAFLPFLILLAAILLFGVTIPVWPVNFPQLLDNSVWIIMQGVRP